MRENEYSTSRNQPLPGTFRRLRRCMILDRNSLTVPSNFTIMRGHNNTPFEVAVRTAPVAPRPHLTGKKYTAGALNGQEPVVDNWK